MRVGASMIIYNATELLDEKDSSKHFSEKSSFLLKKHLTLTVGLIDY